MCLAQGHKAVMQVRLEPVAPPSRIKHSTTEPLRSPWPGIGRYIPGYQHIKHANKAGKQNTAGPNHKKTCLLVLIAL